MTSSANIRAAELGDVPHIKSIVEATELFPADLLDEMMSGYFDGSRPDIWIVHSVGPDVNAFGFCEPERMTEGTWNLLAIAVLPEAQRSGIGARMVSDLEGKLADLGARILLIETMGTVEFESVRRFYRNAGYDEEARIRDFYAAVADKVVFWKRL